MDTQRDLTGLPHPRFAGAEEAEFQLIRASGAQPILRIRQAVVGGFCLCHRGEAPER